MPTQLRIIGALLFAAGIALIALALWWVYKPLAPAAIGLASIYFARIAFSEASKS